MDFVGPVFRAKLDLLASFREWLLMRLRLSVQHCAPNPPYSLTPYSLTPYSLTPNPYPLTPTPYTLTIMESTINWTMGMTFIASQDGHEIVLDLPPDQGGLGLGAKPKTMLLTALGGCTAMDVVSILNKQRVEFDGLKVSTSADLTDEHPKVFKSIHVKYIFSGHDLPMEKLERAAALSMDKYCGVGAMLAKACPITHEIVVEGS